MTSPRLLHFLFVFVVLSLVGCESPHGSGASRGDAGGSTAADAGGLDARADAPVGADGRAPEPTARDAPPAPDVPTAPPPPSCPTPARRCAADGRTPETCLEGKWTAAAACDFLCGGNGECMGACAPTARGCTNGVPQVCTNAGRWTPTGDACPYACVQGTCTGVCVPGRTRCANGAAEKCDEGGQWAAGTGDCTPPTVVSVTPANGARGVRKDAVIVVTFSEPMKRDATERAFNSTDVGPVTFSWSANGTVLTIKPVNGLEYETVTSADASPRRYTVALGSSASDDAGNSLTSVSVSFSTHRRMTRELALVPEGSGYVLHNAVDGSTGVSKVSGGYPVYTSNTGMSVNVRGFLAFDLAPLPADLIEFERATLRVYQSAAPGQDVPGFAIDVERVRSAVLDAGLFDAATIQALGAVSESRSPGWRDKEITQALSASYAERSSSQGWLSLRLVGRVPGAQTYFRHTKTSAEDGPPTISATFLLK